VIADTEALVHGPRAIERSLEVGADDVDSLEGQPQAQSSAAFADREGAARPDGVYVTLPERERP
jgi:hypothetical protein